MRLIDLEPQFLKIESPGLYQHVDSILGAHGIMFLCPICFAKNNGPIGTHSVICWFAKRGVPDDVHPKPGRWNPSGSGYSDLTFIGPGSTSVLLTAGCNAHFFVRGGDIVIC